VAFYEPSVLGLSVCLIKGHFNSSEMTSKIESLR
jgi:hypothetical protein